MKLAIVCDDLIQFGGAEKIVEELSDMHPDAPIYTSVASKKWVNRFKSKGRVVKTSFLQKFPFAVKLNRYYSAFFLHILAFQKFDFSKFDVVISSSARFAHHIITKPTTKHICYMHSPGRMLWESKDYFEKESFGILKPIKKLSNPFLAFPLSYLRIADFTAAQKVDVFVANSIGTQEKIKKYYNRDSIVIYPFIDAKEFEGGEVTNGDFFLVVTRLAPWKRVDIAVEACSSLGIPLKVDGDGADLSRLKSLAGPSVEFLGYVGDEEKIKLMKECKALIVTQKEDFGIVPLEVMACGRPVLAYGKGGATESVISGITGEFFPDQTAESLSEMLKSFDPSKYSAENCKKRAGEFDKSIFQKEIRGVVRV